MNDLLREFLTETTESLDVVDAELVRFEREPNNAEILGNIFRLVHTIKGTCGFLSLPRLEALTHAAETLIDKFRGGAPVSHDAVSLILAVIDRIKQILDRLERTEAEPEGDDGDLIEALNRAAGLGRLSTPDPDGHVGRLVPQTLERPLRAGEVSLDELERAFRAAPSPADAAAGERRMGEERREEERREGAKHQTLRVQVDTLERLMTMVSELVLTRNQLLEIVRHNEDPELKTPLQRLSTITAELQEGVMRTRMQPIGSAWAKLPRLLRDLSTELGKPLELVMQGEDTELDRQVLELIRDPLTHMVRNSADHGIEPAEERRRAGKPAVGTIRLSAHHEGGHIIIEISDDGGGLDTAKIRAKAIRLGLVSEAEAYKLSETQIQEFIFAPGFSTAASVTSISGRGVGMDVVKNNIDQIGGTIELKTVRGQGTTFRVKIPLTLAIVPALIVEAGGDRFAVPQIAVMELVRVNGGSDNRVERINGASVLRLRKKLLPLIDLKSLLRIGAGDAATGFVVVMQVGNRTFGIVVDQVLHTEEIVVKPLSAVLRGTSVYSGTTILGDGSVIMILDPNGVAATLGNENGEEAWSADRGSQADATEEGVSLLVFRAGNRLRAVPLSLVTRLEEIEVDKFEFADGRHVVQYRGGLMPVLCIDDDVKLHGEGLQPLLVFIDAERAMALAVDEIVDIVEERLEISVGSRTPGVLGSAVIAGKATEIIDVGHFLPLAFPDWLHRSEFGAKAARRILLVDDSAFFRNLLAPVLKAAGYEVKAVESGEAALALLAKDHRFDFVVSDIEMPGINGFELAERLRADPRHGGLTLIALAAAAGTAMVEQGRAAGFHCFVAKFDRRGLIAALEHSQPKWAEAA